MTERNIHHEVLREWRAGWGGTLSQPTLVSLFERALDALWTRAHRSLGEMTLMAIVDRVIHQGSERYPHFAALKVETRGVNFLGLRQSAPSLERALLEESLLFLVYELLRVLGTLTGEILSPGLHARLRQVKAPVEDAQGGTS